MRPIVTDAVVGSVCRCVGRSVCLSVWLSVCPVCLSVCHSCEPCINGWADWDVVWGMDCCSGLCGVMCHDACLLAAVRYTWHTCADTWPSYHRTAGVHCRQVLTSPLVILCHWSVIQQLRAFDAQHRTGYNLCSNTCMQAGILTDVCCPNWVDFSLLWNFH